MLASILLHRRERAHSLSPVRRRRLGKSELAVQELRKQKRAVNLDWTAVSPIARGVEAAPDFEDAQSPETYIGYRKAEHFASPERVAHD